MNAQMPDLSKNPYCFYIDPSQGYIPSVVVIDEPGHFPLCGRGDAAAPWRWGKTLDEAEAVRAKANADRGVGEDKVLEIIASSMLASTAGK